MKLSTVRMARKEKPRLAVGHARREQPDRLEREQVLDLEVEDAAVLGLLLVVEQVAAAADGVGVDRDADRRSAT